MKILEKSVKLLFIFSLSLILINSCKEKDPEDEEPQKPEKIEVNEHTKVMPASSKEHIKSINPDTYTFTFDKSDDFINSLEVGDIIVDGVSDKAPYGYLRKIAAITDNNGTKQFQTEFVTLTEAVPTGSIRFNSKDFKKSGLKSVKLADGITLKNNKQGFNVYDFKFEKVIADPSSSSRKITISGETALNLDFFFDFDWEWDSDACPSLDDPTNGVCIKVSLFETGVEINQSATISIVSEVGANFEEQIDIATYIFDPWVVQVGPVPVVFVPKIKLFLKANGEIVAVFSSSVSEEMTGRLGVEYKDGNFKGINEWDFSKNFVAPQLEVNATVEAHIGPQISVLLYGVAGPYINMTACDKLEGELNTNTGNWNLDFGVGLAAKIGLEVDLLGWEDNFTFLPPEVKGISNQFCLGYWSLFHLDNEPFGDHIYISYPTDGSGVGKNSDVTITTEFTGQTPTEVQFFADGILLGNDTSEPFEYVWNTTDYGLGAHTIAVKEFVNGDEISSDEVSVVIENAHWAIEDMSSVMTQSANFTRFQSMYFKGSNRWMSGSYAEKQDEFSNSDVGFLWHSADNGATWEEVSTYSFDGFRDGFEQIQKIQFLNDKTGYMIRNNSCGMCYGNKDLPGLYRTTDGGHTFSIVSYDKSDNDIIMYQFKNFMINNKGQIVGTSGSDNGRISVYDYNESLLRLNPPSSTCFVDLNFDKYSLYGKGNTMMTFSFDSPKYVVSIDGGYNWKEFSLPAANYKNSYIFCDANFVSEDLGFLSVKGGVEPSGYNDEYPIILKTIDGGNNWEAYEITSLEGDNNRFDFIHFISESTGYAWGNEYSGDSDYSENLLYAGIYKTTDGGKTWNRHYEIPEVIERTALNRNLGGLFFNGANEGYAIGQNDTYKIYHFTVE